MIRPRASSVHQMDSSSLHFHFNHLQRRVREAPKTIDEVLAIFQKRVKVETEYSRSLRALSNAALGEARESTTTREAWASFDWVEAGTLALGVAEGRSGAGQDAEEWRAREKRGTPVDFAFGAPPTREAGAWRSTVRRRAYLLFCALCGRVCRGALYPLP